MQPDEDDVKQEVALQRLMGRRVSARIVRMRLRKAETATTNSDLSHFPQPERPSRDIDPVRFPLLFDKAVRRKSVSELLTIHNCRSRQTLSRKLLAEYRLWLEEQG